MVWVHCAINIKTEARIIALLYIYYIIKHKLSLRSIFIYSAKYVLAEYITIPTLNDYQTVSLTVILKSNHVEALILLQTRKCAVQVGGEASTHADPPGLTNTTMSPRKRSSVGEAEPAGGPTTTEDKPE